MLKIFLDKDISESYFRAEYKILMKLRPHRQRSGLCAIYQFLLRRYETSKKPVKAYLHGFDVKLNPGNTYPFIVQDFPQFNAPLVELAHQAFLCKGEKICLLDIGAATGDTVLLLKQRCPEHFEKFICVDGDQEFLGLLHANMAQFDDVEIVEAILAREQIQIPTLVKHHKGTAAAIGVNFTTANSLDSIMMIQKSRVDLMKIDVDGFDGEVLSGATNLLKTHQPLVIFEWHPKLLKDVKNDPLAAFDALASCGYERYLWFNNVGTFSHFSGKQGSETLAKHADYLVKVNSRADAHFDIIAVPDSSNINEMELAAMEYARAK